MANEMVIELCPETGICSIVRSDKGRVDLMPDEVDTIRGARGDGEAIRAILASGDQRFAGALDVGEIAQIAKAV